MPAPYILNPKSETRNPKSEARNPKPGILLPEPYNLNPKFSTPGPQTPKPKPSALPHRISTRFTDRYADLKAAVHVPEIVAFLSTYREDPAMVLPFFFSFITLEPKVQ